MTSAKVADEIPQARYPAWRLRLLHEQAIFWVFLVLEQVSLRR